MGQKRQTSSATRRPSNAQLAAHKAYVELCQDATLREKMDLQPLIMTFEKLQAPQATTVAEYLTSRANPGTEQRSRNSSKHLQERIRILIEAYVDLKIEEGYRLVEADYVIGSTCKCCFDAPGERWRFVRTRQSSSGEW